MTDTNSGDFEGATTVDNNGEPHKHIHRMTPFWVSVVVPVVSALVVGGFGVFAAVSVFSGRLDVIEAKQAQTEVRLVGVEAVVVGTSKEFAGHASLQGHPGMANRVAGVEASLAGLQSIRTDIGRVEGKVDAFFLIQTKRSR